VGVLHDHAPDGARLRPIYLQNGAPQRSAIIPFLASKSLFLLPFGVPGLKKAVIALGLLVSFSVAIVSCGSSSSSKHKISGLAFRAFVSNSLYPSGAANVPVLNIVNAALDTLSPSTVSLLSVIPQAQLMAVSEDLHLTMVFSQSNNAIAVVDNTTEAIATPTGGTSAIPSILLPGLTESMFIATDDVTAYAAVPTAAIPGEPPGAVVVMDLSEGAITATIPVPAAHFIVPTPDGTRILVFSDNSDSISIIAVSLIGTNNNPVTVVSGTATNHFDRPVWAIFTSNSTAEIFDCGPECGGTASGITPFTVGSSAPGSTLFVNGATYGLLIGSTLYVAGTPPHTPCGPGTAVATCGTLNIIDISSMQTTAGPYLIPDGFHDRMQMGANGQLFVGSHSCTSINVLGGEVRGCLAIFNTTTSQVIVPPQAGDATGIQPITGREVVYVCEGGAFSVYDTTTDQILVQTTPIDIVGQSYDVKLVDPPLNQP
jgi:hypothetical protein